MSVVKFKKLDSEAIPFAYTREHDACMDMYALSDVYLRPHRTTIIPTGIAMEIPVGYEGRVIGRSGLSSKGLLVHHGVIEEQYRGQLGVIVTNTGYDSYTFKKGDRIAQFSIHPVVRIDLVETEELLPTDRGSNGYGSSGV